MSHFRMLLASAVAALALAIIGPLFMGVAPAFADGPNMGHPMMHDHDRDDHFRFDRDHRRPFFPPFNVVRPVQFVQPVVSYVQPVVYPVYAQTYAPAYSAPSYFWNSYGAGWNYGMPYSQVQQICGQYNQAMATYSTAAYNQFVSSVCITISVNGNQITIQVYP